MDIGKTNLMLSKFIFNIQKRLNNNKRPENILQCEGGTYHGSNVNTRD